MNINEPLKENATTFKYLVANETDALWGLTITTAGYHRLTHPEAYPLREHPSRYYFDPQKGRVLNEYQLIYITRGGGTFKSKRSGTVAVREGDLFILFPGEWHSYKPVTETGWDEYWVGFKGGVMDNLVKNGFFSPNTPCFYIGISEELVHLYNRIIEAAGSEHASFQPFMAGMVSHMLSLIHTSHRNRQFADKEIITRINKAKVIMQEEALTDITPEDIARRLSLSYSWFRRAFKEYTGFSPAKYMNELKLQRAKALLVTTNKSVKEISISLSFDNVEYFSTFFKKMTGRTPVEFRAYSTKFTEKA